MTDNNNNWGGKREGSGRPKGIKKPYKQISLSLPEEYTYKLKQLAEKRDLSISKLLQELIDKNWED